MQAHSHTAVPITSATDGFSSSSVLNEYKYVCLTSFICQRGAHLPCRAKRGSVALHTAGEGSMWKKETEDKRKKRIGARKKTLRDKNDPRESNKFGAKQ